MKKSSDATEELNSEDELRAQEEEAVESTDHRVRYSIRALLLALLGVGLLMGAARRVLYVAISPRGMLIAALMGTVGFAVGRVAGQAGSPAPKAVLFIVCLLFYAGLSGGHIRTGEPLTVWAFLCASTAIMIGILFSQSDAGNDCSASC